VLAGLAVFAELGFIFAAEFVGLEDIEEMSPFNNRATSMLL
jgi:hypothetical protein